MHSSYRHVHPACHDIFAICRTIWYQSRSQQETDGSQIRIIQEELNKMTVYESVVGMERKHKGH